VTELTGAHDLGPDPDGELLREGVVDAAAAALTGGASPPAGREHPLVQAVSGMAEVKLGALALAGAEAVERDAEVLDAS